jgi:hypothetical protein
MKQIRIMDNNFGHGESSCHGRKPKNFVWDRRVYPSEICFYTDNCVILAASDTSKVKIAWLYEPRAINPFTYDFVAENHHLFDHIFTYDLDLIKINPKFKYYPHGSCWITDENIGTQPKTHLCSIIASHKNQTTGHQLRHSVINHFKDRITVLGRGYKAIADKIEGLGSYKYSIVIENSKQDDYFTEKLIDCFATGVIPIYWGTNNINKYFDDVITFETLEDLEKILNYIGDDHYTTQTDTIKRNLEKVPKYLVSEDYFFDNYRELFTF